MQMKWGGRRGKALGRNQSDATPRLKKDALGSLSKLCFISRHVMQFEVSFLICDKCECFCVVDTCFICNMCDAVNRL